MTRKGSAMPGGPLSCWNAGMGAGGWMTAGRLQAGATVGAFSAALPLAANAGAGAAAAMRRRPAIPAGAERCAQSGSAVQVGQCGVVFGARFVQLALGLVDPFRLALGASLLEFAFAFGDLVLFRARRLRAGSAGGYRCSAPWLRPARGAGRLPGGCCRAPGPARCRFRSGRTWRRSHARPSSRPPGRGPWPAGQGRRPS